MGHMMGEDISAVNALHLSVCLSVSHPTLCIFCINTRLSVCHTKRTFSWPVSENHAIEHNFHSSFKISPCDLMCVVQFLCLLRISDWLNLKLLPDQPLLRAIFPICGYLQDHLPLQTSCLHSHVFLLVITTCFLCVLLYWQHIFTSH